MAQVQFNQCGFYPRIIFSSLMTGARGRNFYDNWNSKGDLSDRLILHDYTMLKRGNSYTENNYYYNSTYPEDKVRRFSIPMFTDSEWNNAAQLYTGSRGSNVNIITSKSNNRGYFYYGHWGHLVVPPFTGYPTQVKLKFNLIRHLDAAYKRIDINMPSDINIKSDTNNTTFNLVMDGTPNDIIKYWIAFMANGDSLSNFNSTVWGIYPGLNNTKNVDTNKIIKGATSLNNLSFNNYYSFLDSVNNVIPQYASSRPPVSAVDNVSNYKVNETPIDEKLPNNPFNYYRTGDISWQDNWDNAPQSFLFMLFQNCFKVTTKYHENPINIRISSDKRLSWNNISTATNGYVVQILKDGLVDYSISTNTNSVIIPDKYLFDSSVSYRVKTRTNKFADINKGIRTELSNNVEYFSCNEYLDSDWTIFSGMPKILPPSNLLVNTTIDNAKLSWTYSYRYETYNVNYKVVYTGGKTGSATTKRVDYTESSFDNVEYSNANKVSVQAYIAGHEDETLSDILSSTFATTKLSIPINFAFSQRNINNGNTTWGDSSTYNKEFVEYGIKLNGTLLGYTKDKFKLIPNMQPGTNTIQLFSHYTKNADYDSDYYTIKPVLNRIQKPTLGLIENYGDVSYTDPNTGKKVIIYDEKGNPRQGVMSITANWLSQTAAQYSGVEYILYDRFNGNVYAQPRTSDNKITLSTQATFKGVGRHNLYVKAIYKADERFNSDTSSEVYYDINTLEKPKLIWANTLPGWSGKRIEESKLTWMPVTAGSSTNAHADYYLVKAIGDGVSKGNSVTVLQPADLSKRLSIYIPDPNPETGSSNGLISEIPAKTTDYKINVYALSFNEFYVGGSEAATEDYKIIRLNAPTNVNFNPDTQTLSWNAVTNANTYYIYDGNVKVAETNTNSYKFSKLENKLHIFNITANKITKEEA